MAPPDRGPRLAIGRARGAGAARGGGEGRGGRQRFPPSVAFGRLPDDAGHRCAPRAPMSRSCRGGDQALPSTLFRRDVRPTRRTTNASPGCAGGGRVCKYDWCTGRGRTMRGRETKASVYPAPTPRGRTVRQANNRCRVAPRPAGRAYKAPCRYTRRRSLTDQAPRARRTKVVA